MSSFLDGELDGKKSQAVRGHISMCADCARIYEDFASLLNVCKGDFAKAATPPNSQALWRRINNIIESDIQQEIETEKSKHRTKSGLIPKVLKSKWKFSAMQIGSALLVVAIISSSLTILGIKSFTSSSRIPSEVNVEPTIFEPLLADFGVVKTKQQIKVRKIRVQKSTIEYWEKLAQTRKIQWDSNLRNAFDRNLSEIDKAVNEYIKALEKKPQDKIYNEMLDSALDEKMDFLREFSEL